MNLEPNEESLRKWLSDNIRNGCLGAALALRSAAGDLADRELFFLMVALVRAAEIQRDRIIARMPANVLPSAPEIERLTREHMDKMAEMATAFIEHADEGERASLQ